MSRKYSSLDDLMEDFKSKGYYHEWSEFILYDVLVFSTTRDLMSEIYEAIQRRYPDICVNYILYWGKPKWIHMVRSVLDGLMKKGCAQSEGGGKWRRLK